MAAPQRSASDAGSTALRSGSDDKSVGVLLGELWTLVVAYAKQETVDPLKALARFVAFGVLGALFLSVGCFLVALAIVRALQVELVPHLNGNLTWVPYLGGFLFLVLAAVLSVSRVAKAPR